MRIFLIIFFSTVIVSLKAQVPVGLGYSQRSPFGNYYRATDSSDLNKKWSLSKYGSFSASYAFFNGGSASIFSAPIGLQLNRRLNNNLYAFAGVSVAPSYINFNQSFNNAGSNKRFGGNNLSGSNNFGIYSRAEMGLMYVNDQKTFSISGSIGIERSNYPIYYPSHQTQQPVYQKR